jgi:hypothetical protein
MATIKEAVNKVVGNDSEKVKQREILSLLAEASESRAKLMVQDLKTYIRTAGTDENKSIPVTDILAEFLEVRVTTQESMGNFVEKIGESIKTMMSGNILDGVISMVSGTMGDLIGSTSSSEMTRRQYFVGVEGLAMVRYDISYWSREITIESIKKTAEKSLICVLTKSSIDVPMLKFNSFLSVYQTLLSAKKGLTHEQLLDEIRKAREVYSTLGGGANTLLTSSQDETEQVLQIDSLGAFLTTSSSDTKPTSSWPEI